MKIITATSFLSASIPGRLDHPCHSLTLIVKGTFSLNPEEKVTPAEEPYFPGGDEFYSDGEGSQGSVRYESDFAWFKPKADLLLTGKCHTPDGKPMQICPVTFRVGSRSRSLAVFGNRQWKRNAFGLWKITEPEPFKEMDLRYENSFGGEGSSDNPVGKGFNWEQDQTGRKVRLLPNIEDPNTLIDSPKRRPLPAGFGPLNRMWLQRRSRMGTYKGKYRKERWPWVPEDFDWSHFNAAPAEMQVEGYLRGDETLYFENLHPSHPQYHSRLPGIRVRCFLNELTETEEEETNFKEVSMNMDTLWADMESQKLVLVWRGWATVLSEDHDEIKELFILSEPLEKQPASLEECQQLFYLQKAEQEKAWAVESEKPETTEIPPEDNNEPVSSNADKPDLNPAHVQAQADALLAQMGINPESLSPESRETQARIIQKLTETDPAKVADMERRELDSQLRVAFSKLNLDPDRPPPLSAKAKAEQLRFMKELGVKPADAATDSELGKVWALMGAALPKMGIDPENLEPLMEQVKKQTKHLKKQFGIDEELETETEKEAEASPLTRETVQERATRGDSFAGEDLHGLDLSQLELSDLDFSSANLTGTILIGTNLRSALLADADLTGVDLSEADLTGANLAGADLSKSRIGKAVLKGADLTGCIMQNSDLTEAILADAVFEKAQMAGAVLDQVDAGDTNFSEADLTESRFRKSSCPGADFSKAVLDHADFQGADLREASLEGAVGREIYLAEADLTKLRASEGCDFTDGVFWNSIGAGSIWEDSNLTGSDFRGSRLEGATFTNACLKQANLSAADMKFSRFNKANLQEAQLIQMNLFQGSLEKADLSGADLSGSNMYGVEFLDAAIEGIRVDGANLKMSKLREMMKQA